MTVTVRYTAQARQASGLATEEIDVGDDASLQALLRRLAARHGPRMAGLLFADETPGRPRPAMLVFVGDDQVDWSSPPALKPGDTVLLLSPIAGG